MKIRDFSRTLKGQQPSGSSGCDLGRLIFWEWSGVGKAQFWLTRQDRWGVARLKEDPYPQERAHFPFLSTLDKSLSNVTPQMSLIMCVANFRVFFFSFLKIYFLFESVPSHIA